MASMTLDEFQLRWLELARMVETARPGQTLTDVWSDAGILALAEVLLRIEQKLDGGRGF